MTCPSCEPVYSGRSFFTKLLNHTLTGFFWIPQIQLLATCCNIENWKQGNPNLHRNVWITQITTETRQKNITRDLRFLGIWLPMDFPHHFPRKKKKSPRYCKLRTDASWGAASEHMSFQFWRWPPLVEGNPTPNLLSDSLSAKIEKRFTKTLKM